MKAFPMFIRTTDRRVVIVGGGEQAAQKARLMLKTDAQIVLVAPELDEETQKMIGGISEPWATLSSEHAKKKAEEKRKAEEAAAAKKAAEKAAKEEAKEKAKAEKEAAKEKEK
ncbi:MAG: NAD(P)-dependent oxidoreductase, partial [Pseudomonadota bacterium]|nr:NAD(P)-dependent oxidoreductase [Pseudomonadota bacterium]